MTPHFRWGAIAFYREEPICHVILEPYLPRQSCSSIDGRDPQPFRDYRQAAFYLALALEHVFAVRRFAPVQTEYRKTDIKAP